MHPALKLTYQSFSSCGCSLPFSDGTVDFGVGVAPMVLGKLLGPTHPDPEKLSPYECGFEAFEDARMKFDVRYYLVAILFILFDLEIAFLFPWAVVINDIGLAGYLSMMLFLAILPVGLV